MLTRYSVNDRVQWFTRGAVGTIAAIINGGMAYLFHADSGAKFTARADELSPLGTPDRIVPSAPMGEARTVFKVDAPAGMRQRTPSQQQQARDDRSIEIEAAAEARHEGRVERADNEYDANVDKVRGDYMKVTPATVMRGRLLLAQADVGRLGERIAQCLALPTKDSPDMRDAVHTLEAAISNARFFVDQCEKHLRKVAA